MEGSNQLPSSASSQDEKCTLSQGYAIFQGDKTLRYSGPDLPKDIWHHILSLMPLRDAARAACVSRGFLCSWRCRPNLIFTKETLSLEQNRKHRVRKGDKTCAFASRVDHILKNHSGIGVKRLELSICDFCGIKVSSIDRWLQIAITPGIEEIILLLPSNYMEMYNFPLSLLFDGRGSSIQYLDLMYCTLRPTVGLGCLRSMAKLCLSDVCIMDDELVSLLSKSFALEELELRYCSEIICLMIPCLERLKCLTVFECINLQMIKSNAPNITTFSFYGDPIELSLGESSQVKELDMSCSDVPNFICYSITKLPYIVPNLISLTLSSVNEGINTPTVAAKFLHLQRLEICLEADKAMPPEYDYLSLVSFLEASPVLETFILSVYQYDMKHDSVSEEALHMREMPEHKHSNLKNVMILGFCSAKSMVELACHVLKNTTSLKSITLDTVYDCYDVDKIGRCYTTSAREIGECKPLTRQMILEAERGSMAIERYILGKVPSTVELTVRGPCVHCHDIRRAKTRF
uniref:Uncharacterized protein n=1 Tax=Leersia perrieri TaxID=77586 RepID=A0A0D9VA63_9ORYZ